ncbi:MAG: TOBE domain-containing protein [Albidovulum sp.]|nr:TOBE domain-containing protein [Albidovulum sp.]MDE0303352.1 TOBE domain-containing protein [Albidovulum sp.]MDE0534226.1 TOBE domain-containing protein [Albidovulum sp.]
MRPEHVSIADEDPDIAGTVFAVEYTGSELLIVADTGGDRISLIGDLARRPKIDERIGLRIDRGETFFFDAQTGARIRKSS